MESDYTEGFKAGKDRARKEIIDLIELHINSNVELSDQELVREIEHLQKIDKENGLWIRFVKLATAVNGITAKATARCTTTSIA